MKPHYRAWILCSMLAASLAPGAPAYAQPKTDPTQRATELYKKGNEFYDKSKWADAETMYRAAFELRQSFEIAGNLGDVELIQGKPRDAAEHLGYAVRGFPPSGKPAQKEALQKRLREATNMIGTVQIKVNMPGAEVLIDDKLVGKAPLDYELYVDRGEHVVSAKLEGYEPVQEKLTATSGSKHEVNLTLKKPEGPKAAKGAVELGGGEPEGGEGEGGSKRNTIIIVGGIMVSAAALATGIGLTAAANGKADDAGTKRTDIQERHPGVLCPVADPVECADLHSILRDKDSFTNTAVAAFVIGGVAATATAVYAFWPAPKSGRAATVRPVPVVTATEGGLWLKGTF